MPALKDVGNLAHLPGASMLRIAGFWQSEVGNIAAVQLHAFVRRMADKGLADQAASAIQIMLNEVERASLAGDFPRPRMLDFRAPIDARLTLGEFRAGMGFLGMRKAAAVLYALETGMSGHDVGRLTWPQHLRKRLDEPVSELALACTKVCPRHISLQYVFWELHPETHMAMPMYGLESDVFQAFMLVWGELEAAYKTLIWVDSAQDAYDLLSRLGDQSLTRGDPGLKD